MAAQTFSTSLNLDDASKLGLLNGETVTIDTGATLTVDSDNRWSQQAAVLGSVTVSSVSGGKFLIDSSKVWQVPFSASSGNVPALGTVNVQNCTGGTSAATGEFLGVWATGEMTPRAAGGAMPATGYVKFRSKVGNFDATSETITLPGGATITSTGPGVRSWIHVVGNQTGAVTVPRLGEWSINDGDTYWYELGTTNGADDQTFDLPFLDNLPAFQMETAPGSGEFEWWKNSGARWGTATQFVATDERGKFFGQWKTIVNAGTTSGLAVVTTTDTAGLEVGMPIHASAGWAALSSLYIIAVNPGVSFTVNTNANATSGTVTIRSPQKTITIARRASNSCGFKPASGCRVRIPNVILSQSISAGGWLGQTAPLAAGDRWETATTAAGVINWGGVVCNVYLNASAPYSVSVNGTCFDTIIAVSNTAATTEFNDCAIGVSGAWEATPASFSNLFTSLTLAKFSTCRYAAGSAGHVSINIQDSANVALTDVEGCLFGSTTAVTRDNTDIRSIAIIRCVDVAVTRPSIIGGRLYVEQTAGAVITDIRFADQRNGSTVNTNSLTAAINVLNTSADIYIDGFSAYAGLANVHPYNAILALSGSPSSIEFVNLGTAAAPYNCGSANATGLIVSASVTLGLQLRRLYAMNTRTAALSLANTVRNVVLDNVWCDGADAQAIAAVPAIARGCRWTNSVTGQTAVYGRHWEDAFVTTTAGRLLIACNEPLAATADQAAIIAGNPRFNSAGSVVMPSVGDEIIWTMPYFAIGHTALANIAPTVTGVNTGNMALSFQIDTGSGWNGTWLTLNAANLSAQTIPAWSSFFSLGGFRMKIRAVTTAANATNALAYIRIDTVTTATEQQRRYALRNPQVGYSGAAVGSLLALFDDATSELAGSASEASGFARATPPWDANYTAVSRLRKPGYAPVEASYTIDNDGQTLPVEQTDWSAIPDTDPGALGITVTNHGGTPITWNAKDFSITITTTNDALTAAEVAQYISWNTSHLDAFNGFSGMAWPYMVEPDGSGFKTVRGRLVGSAGAMLKGVRVVRSDGTTPVVGFTSMMADDGTTWSAPVTGIFAVTGLVANSGVVVRNVTTNTTVHNAIVAGTSWSTAYTDGTTFTDGDSYEVLVTFVNGATAKRPLRFTGVVAATGATVAVAQTDWTEYIAAGIDGSTVSECATDYANDQVDVNDSDNSTTKARIAAFIVYAMHAEATGRLSWNGAIEYRSAGSAVIKTAVAPIRVDNVKPTALDVLDSFQLRRDDGSSPIAGSTYTINWDNSAEVIVVTTGGSALTPAESAHLLALDTQAVNVETMNGAEVIGTGVTGDPWRGLGEAP